MTKLSNKDKIILDLCGGTGAWSKPYANAGYDVRIITLPDYDVRMFPSKRGYKSRYPREFEDIMKLGKVHGILAAPPCTYFAGSGASWPRTDGEMLEGISIVDACIRLVYVLKPKWWALENPVGKLRKWLGPPVMSFNPCDYGDAYKKKTLLWGRFNTNLIKNPVTPIVPSPLHLLPPSKDRAAIRSITPAGFAKAFFEANP